MTGAATGATVLQGGRAKAYRPLPVAVRAAAIRDGLAAYERGDFFLAHELLEPAWMGTAELPERELVQGLIKLAAAHVHGVRGNPLGVVKNLRGARERFVAAGPGSGAGVQSTARSRFGAIAELDRLDIEALVAAIDRRLGAGAAQPAQPHEPIGIPRR
jgi:hypothetical protein